MQAPSMHLRPSCVDNCSVYYVTLYPPWLGLYCDAWISVLEASIWVLFQRPRQRVYNESCQEK